MVDLLAYPVRVGPDGRFVTVEDGPDYYPQELVCLVKTEPGERVLVPTYGIEDPTFTQFRQIELEEKISTFGPPVLIDAVNVKYPQEGKMAVEIEWHELPIDEDSQNEFNFDFPQGTDNFIGDEDLSDESDYDDQGVYDFVNATDA